MNERKTVFFSPKSAAPGQPSPGAALSLKFKKDKSVADMATQKVLTEKQQKKKEEREKLQKQYEAAVNEVNKLLKISFIKEFPFLHGKRQWKLDFAMPCCKIAIEVEGGLFTGGRHGRGAGLVADMAKYNRLAIEGWRLLRYPPSQVKTNKATLFVNLEDLFLSTPCTHQQTNAIWKELRGEE